MEIDEENQTIFRITRLFGMAPFTVNRIAKKGVAGAAEIRLGRWWCAYSVILICLMGTRNEIRFYFTQWNKQNFTLQFHWPFTDWSTIPIQPIRFGMSWTKNHFFFLLKLKNKNVSHFQNEIGYIPICYQFRHNCGRWNLSHWLSVRLHGTTTNSSSHRET